MGNSFIPLTKLDRKYLCGATCWMDFILFDSSWKRQRTSNLASHIPKQICGPPCPND